VLTRDSKSISAGEKLPLDSTPLLGHFADDRTSLGRGYLNTEAPLLK